jgi:very-short-patch-repair endonuclease
MRGASTWAEDWLWERLRRDALGVRFRRQHVIDRFIADFYCAERGLVVEVDGPVHEGRGELDAERDCLFLTKGLVVLRVRNEDVRLDLDAVVARIRALCS